MEAQLLHIQSKDHKEWRLAGCIPLSTSNISSSVIDFTKDSYLPGVLQVISQTLSVDGPCYGWQLHSIGRKYVLTDNSWEAVVIVVKKKDVNDTKPVAEKWGKSEKTTTVWEDKDADGSGRSETTVTSWDTLDPEKGVWKEKMDAWADKECRDAIDKMSLK